MLIRTIAGALLGAVLTAPLGAQTSAPRPDSTAATLAAAPSQPASPLEAAVREFRATGRARTLPPLDPGDFTTYPYGYARPVLRCAAFKVCQIELQAGEDLADDPLPGDRDRWDVDRTLQGGRTVLLIRPKGCDLDANLVVATTRRRYVVDLVAPACRKGGDYMPGIRFWYPDEAVHGGAQTGALDGIVVDLGRVNTRYGWRPDRHIAWSPARVFDDGRRTYIQFAPGARDGELPSLYALAADGSREAVTTFTRPDPQGDYLVADRVFDRAVLVARSGKRERKMEIINWATRR